MVKKGLGRGLGSLIPTYRDEPETEAPKRTATVSKEVGAEGTGVAEIKLSSITANSNQPRKHFDETTLKELAVSIKRHGVMQPIVVVKASALGNVPRGTNEYVIVAGERRYRAAQIVGLDTIPAIVKDYDKKKIQELALIENLQREDLTPVEVAYGLQELIDTHNFTQEALAASLGLGRSTVTNYLRILTLSDFVLDLINKGEISFGHAKIIASAEKRDQDALAREAAKQKLSIKQLEIGLKKSTGKEAVKTTPQSVELKDLTKKLGQAFGTRATCLGNDKKGRFIIEYFNRDDLDRIFDIVEKIVKSR